MIPLKELVKGRERGVNDVVYWKCMPLKRLQAKLNFNKIEDCRNIPLWKIKREEKALTYQNPKNFPPIFKVKFWTDSNLYFLIIKFRYNACCHWLKVRALSEYRTWSWSCHAICQFVTWRTKSRIFLSGFYSTQKSSTT